MRENVDLMKHPDLLSKSDVRMRSSKGSISVHSKENYNNDVPSNYAGKASAIYGGKTSVNMEKILKFNNNKFFQKKASAQRNDIFDKKAFENPELRNSLLSGKFSIPAFVPPSQSNEMIDMAKSSVGRRATLEPNSLSSKILVLIIYCNLI